MSAKWQRITDPELAAELYSGKLLYEFGGVPPKDTNFGDRQPQPAVGWGSSWDWILGLSAWSFYVLLEE